jgi:type III pantothenate kinase
MILVVDVGNTNIVLGLYQGRTLTHHWRLSTNRSSTVDEYGILISNLFQLAGVRAEQIKGVHLNSFSLNM